MAHKITANTRYQGHWVFQVLLISDGQMRPSQEPEVITIDSDEEDDNTQMHDLDHLVLDLCNSQSSCRVHSGSDQFDTSHRWKSVNSQGSNDHLSSGKGMSDANRPDNQKQVRRQGERIPLVKQHQPPSATSRTEPTAKQASFSSSTPHSNGTRRVGLTEAKLSYVLEQVHGFQGTHTEKNVSSPNWLKQIDRRGNESDTSDEVEIIGIRHPGTFNPSESNVDEVPLIGTITMATRKRMADSHESRYKHSRNCQQNYQQSRPSRWKKSQQQRCQPECRYVLHQARHQPSQGSTKRASWAETNFNANMSREDAMREQEKLFQESAARVRSQTRFQIAQNSATFLPPMITFSQPIVDVHSQFPGHWKFPDPYARLGLPNNSPIHLVKAHYRILARFYHPDKSRSEQTAIKFQAIAEAYSSITNAE